MEWTIIKRGKWGGVKMPDNILRLTRSTIAVSENISETIQLGRTSDLDSNTEKVSLGIAVGSDNKSIKLYPGAIDGFKFYCKNAGYKNLMVTKPAGLKKLDLPVGDYVATDSQALEFVLAE